MSKILLLGDLHLGCRNASRIFLEHQKKYFHDELFPYIIDNDIKTVIQLGDIVDKRKSIDFAVSHFMLNDFFKFFEENKIDMYCLLGNHDLYFRQSLEIAGVAQYMKQFQYIHSINEPTQLNVEGKLMDSVFMMIPWVCEENKVDIAKALQTDLGTDKKRILCGHLELSGFPIQKGYNSETDSFDRSLLNQFDKVMSGHYHSPSDGGKITYVGTPYQMTWSDYGDKKKFIVYDTDDFSFTEVFTKAKLFHKVLYSNDILKSFNFNDVKNSFIKIIMPDEKISNAKFDIFMSELEEKSTPSNVQVIDVKTTESDDIFNIELDDPMTILIKTLQTTIEDENILSLSKKYVDEIYKQTMENTTC